MRRDVNDLVETSGDHLTADDKAEIAEEQREWKALQRAMHWRAHYNYRKP